MTETLNHRLLKLLGVKYLNKVGCRLVTTEVWIIGDWSIEDQLTKDTDNKRVIDVVGLLEYDPTIHPADCYIKIRRRPTFQQTRQSLQAYLTFRITDRQHGAYMDIVRDQITQLTNLKND